MKTLVKLALALGFMTTITACNTVKGAGQDIEEAGERIEDAAE
jgi:predicted small secreted protein